jgi:CRISPR type I-D-associated protein Csc2
MRGKAGTNKDRPKTEGQRSGAVDGATVARLCTASENGKLIFEELDAYLVPTIPALLGVQTIQILLVRETLDEIILRTEETREINDIVTPDKDGKAIQRVAFLGSKQKAVESRALEHLLRTASAESGFDYVKTQGAECALKKVCLRCPRCGLFGCTAATAEGKGANIRHRIEYSTAFSLIPYGEATDERTFNAIHDATQQTGQALGARPVVKPGVLFGSIVSLRCCTQHELALVLKVLLQTRSYGAESRTSGDMRNHIMGIVAGWEEVLTPLEWTLELERQPPESLNSTSAEVVVGAVNRYWKLAAHPSKVLVITDSEGVAGAMPERGGEQEQNDDQHLRSSATLKEIIDGVRGLEIDSGFLTRAYSDVQHLREEQDRKKEKQGG